MKTVYESILSSTNSGKNKVVADLKEWIVKAFNVSSNNMFDLERTDEIDVSPKNGRFSINVKTTYDKDFIRFNNWYKGDIDFIKQIDSVYINKKPVNVTYAGVNFDKNEKFVSIVQDSLTLCGGEIYLVDELPSKCRTLRFEYMHNLGGGSPVRVKEIKNIIVDDFVVTQRSNGTSTLSCNIDRIKNITVRNKMHITDGMLGYSSLEKGARTFEKETSEMLDRFFKDNKVDPSKVVFYPDPKQSKKQMSIYYNKQKERWCTKPYTL